MQASASLSAGTTQPDGISRSCKDLQSMVTSTFPPSLSVLTSFFLWSLDQHIQHHPSWHSWSDQYLSGCLSWGPVELQNIISMRDFWPQAISWSKGPSEDFCGRACMCTRQGIPHLWRRGNMDGLVSRRHDHLHHAAQLLHKAQLSPWDNIPCGNSLSLRPH